MKNQEKITKVYTGNANGCRCGCNGDYAYDQESIAKALDTVEQWLTTDEIITMEQTSCYFDYTKGNQSITFYFN